MQFTVLQVQYSIGQDPVTIVTQNPLGGLTNVQTTQTALQSHCAPGGTWGDNEALAEATAKIPPMFPSVTGITVALNT